MLPEITINPNRIELDEAYLQMAEVWSLRSKANRSQVGALIVKDEQIISDGYNGMPAGSIDDVCEFHAIEIIDADKDQWHHVLKTKPEVLHAESNALMKISKKGGVGCEGGTLYVTMSPCPECAKLIIQAKIARVVYRKKYRLTDGIDLLNKYKIPVTQINKKEG